jgi:aryl-alcohol dehydrogenase-like predicted oxidoreductase
MPTADFAHGPSTIRLGDLEVCRLGFGAMRLPGKDVWGEPDDPARAVAVVRRVVELGMNFIDTSWYYGPLVSNRIIAEALHPYPAGLVIATKLGGKRLPDKGWAAFIRPEELREGAETDLKTLRKDVLDVVHLRFIPSDVPFLESLDALIALVKAGKIRHLALSNVNRQQVVQALERTPIVAVQNLYNVGGGSGRLAQMTHAEVESPDDVLALCNEKGIAFLPFFPLGIGSLGRPHPALDTVAQARGATTAQVALAWLLAKSKVILPIPGTSSPAHLEENWGARSIPLSADEIASIEREARAAG